MSRNKDKHEGASGRTYHIMSEAERASGRRGGWTTLEVSLGHEVESPESCSSICTPTLMPKTRCLEDEWQVVKLAIRPNNDLVHSAQSLATGKKLC